MAIQEVKDDGGWHHPAPFLNIGGVRYTPTVSDGFKAAKTATHRRHLGVDVDYQKKGKTGELPQYVKLPEATNSKRYAYFFPRNIPMRCARDGVVWWAGLTERGHGVLIVHDHGKLQTFYQHLESLAEPFVRGETITAGTILGPAGYNPSGYKFRHLHFEIRVWDGSSGHFISVDPEKIGGKFLKNFPIEYEVTL